MTIHGTSTSLGPGRTFHLPTDYDDRGRFALGAGVLSFFVLFAPLQELDPKRTDAPGMAIVGLAALALLLWGRRSVWRRTALLSAAPPR